MEKQKTEKVEKQKTGKVEKQKLENWKNGLTSCKISKKI